VYLKLFL
jgi:nuclear autoantigenic sperm protein